MYKNKILIALVSLILIASCKDSNNLVDQILENVERGAIIRTISSEGTSWNVTDENSTLTLRLEAQDEEMGELLREVRFFASFIDNTSGNTINPAEVLLETIPAADWEGDVWGLPRTTFDVTLSEIAAALGGLQLGDYNCGDEFNIRLEVELIDGRVWTNTDLAGTVAGGSFFSSPLNYRIPLVFFLPSDTVYTGSYQLNTIITGTVLGGTDFVDGIYTIDAVDEVTRVIRSVPTLPEFGPFGPVDVTFSFVCNEIVMGVNSYGASCGNPLTTGPADVNDTFDLANPDDSQFTLFFVADSQESCGSPGPGEIQLVKQ